MGPQPRLRSSIAFNFVRRRSEGPAWKHKLGGEILKQDVYAYRIVYQIESTGGVREHLGHVTLLK